jgi:hypothetical protein
VVVVGHGAAAHRLAVLVERCLQIFS